MEFFDKLKRQATETYKGAAEKTGKLAKEAKLKLKINDNKSKINDLYQEIGKKVYQKHTANEELCIKKELEEECVKIDILCTEIENYNKEIMGLSDMKTCAKCNEPMDKNAKFCPKCGEGQPEEPVFEAEVIDNNGENAENNAEEQAPVEECNCENTECNCEVTETEQADNTPNEDNN